MKANVHESLQFNLSMGNDILRTGIILQKNMQYF